jgi:hypothetical protein
LRRLALVLLALAALPAAALDRLVFTFDDVDTSTTAAVRLYTDAPLKRPILHYMTAGAAPKQLTAEERVIPGAGRVVYAFALRGLEPDTVYRFRVADGDAWRGEVRELKSMPAKLTRLKIVTGGDAGPSRLSAQMWARAAREEPDVVVFGGDLAYANGDVGAAALWDTFLGHYEAAFAQRRMTPVIAAIGNHEVQGGFRRSAEAAPFYYAVFGDPDEPAYAARDLAGVRLLLLDSGHTAPHDGAQLEWLQRAMKPERTWRLAVYHVPLFPSVRALTVDEAVAGRQHWLPVFAHELDVAFENHDHALKRTRRDGVLFLGDGCWGRPPRSTSTRDYLEASSSVNHVWSVELEPGVLRARALGVDGAVLDKASLLKAP